MSASEIFYFLRPDSEIGVGILEKEFLHSFGFTGARSDLQELQHTIDENRTDETTASRFIPFDLLNEFTDVPVWIVVDRQDEAAQLQRLRMTTDQDRSFLGLGADILPAIVARNAAHITNEAMATPSTLTLILAPPRSGSSFVADLVGQITETKTREHLRKDVISALAAPYAFDRVAAMRRFLGLIANQRTGQASTKIITHFVQDYVAEVGDLNVLKEAASGIDVKPIILDRTDHVGQAVSGYLARARGIWHLESGRDIAALARADKVPYDFNAILQLYLGYRQQSYVLDFAREIFPDHLALEYGRDIEAGDAVALGERIAAFLGLPWDPAEQPTGRAKLANEENARLCARFREDYRELFGQDAR